MSNKGAIAVLTPPLIVLPTCIIIDKFPLGDKTCELLAFHQPGERLVNSHKMLLLGRKARASMTEDAFQYFWKHQKDVPFRHWRRYFIFPEAFVSRGRVRCAYRPNDNWCHFKRWLGLELFCCVVLVRLTPACT